MKLLHVPFAWYPEACGGTEVYVRSLMRELSELGFHSEIAIPSASESPKEWDGVQVHRLPIAPRLTQPMLYGEGDPVSAEAFSAMLSCTKPDLVHFHSYSPAVSVRWLQAALDQGIACVYTYHTPTLACSRGTLMRWGDIPCDGVMSPLRCSACMLNGKGMSRGLASALSLFSPVTQCLNSRVPFNIWPLMKLRSRAVKQWLSGMAHIVALCEWGREVLIRNDVALNKLSVIRHGLPGGHKNSEARVRKDLSPVRVAFFGRLDPTKGLQVLLDAFQLKPDLKVELHCHLIRDVSVQAEMALLASRLKADTRIHLHPSVPPDDVVSAMSNYDLVAVPSIWLETGPLVVLEAFEAGVPVIGSSLGGIAEWVIDEKNGLLIQPGKVDAWAAAIARLVDVPGLLEQLRAGVSPPPRMKAVALEMTEVYRGVIASSKSKQ